MLTKFLSGDQLLCARYTEARVDGIINPNSFCERTNTPWFDLTFIYPVRDKIFLSELMKVQQEIKKILGSDAPHHYQAEQDIHLTFYCHAEGPVSTPDSIKEDQRKSAQKMFNDHTFINPWPIFQGGCVGRNAIIIHGYDSESANRDRLKLVYEGIAKSIYDKTAINNVRPNLVHISLIRLLKEPISIAQRYAINRLLEGMDFGTVSLSEIGLYEFSRYGIFSSGKMLATKKTKA